MPANNINVQISATTGQFENGVRVVKRDLNELKNSVDRVDSGVGSLKKALYALTGVGAFVLLQRAASSFFNQIKAGIEAVDNFKLGNIQMAAILTSLAKDQNDLPETYRKASAYAEGLNESLQKVDANVSLNLENLQSITQEMAKQGVALDYNNQSQIDSFTRIANAVAVYSRNGADEKQVRQEIAALMRGEARQGAELAKLMNRITNGDLKKMVAQWKESGTVVDELGKRLAGFGPAADDISATFGAATSSLETSVNIIQRAGFAEITADVTNYLGIANDYLQDHATLIGGVITQAWLSTKGAVESIYNIFFAVGAPLGIVVKLGEMIFGGWGLLVYSVLPELTSQFNHLLKLLNATLHLVVGIGSAMLSSVGVVGESMASIGKAAWQALTGDFDGARESLQGMASGFFVETFQNDIALIKGSIIGIGEEWDGMAGPLDRMADRANEFLSKTTEAKKSLEDINAAPPELGGNADEDLLAQKALKKATSERLKLERQLLKLQGDTAALRAIEREGLSESNRTLYDQVKALEDQKDAADLIAKTANERLGLERQLLKLQGDTAALRAIERADLNESNRVLYDQIKALEDQLAAKKITDKLDKERETKLKKQQDDIAKEWQKTSDMVGQSLTDALMEGGKSAADYIKGLFRSMVLRPLMQPLVGGVVGAFMGGGAATAMAGEPGAMGQAMGLGSTAGALKSAYDIVTSGFTNLGTSVTGAVESVGQFLAYNFTGTLEGAGIALEGASAAIGTAASYLGGIGAGIGLGNMISGDMAAIGGNSMWATGIGTAVGAIFGPLGAAIGGVLGGVVNKAFGMGPKKVKDYGISGEFDTSGADVMSFQKWKKKGGLFRSNKSGTDYSDVSAEIQQFFDGAILTTTSSVRQYADMLGMAPDAIDSFSQQIKISLKGLSEDEQTEAISGALNSFFEEMIQSAYGNELGSLVAAGESAMQTLERLSTRLQAVNQIGDVLSLGMYDLSIEGATLASTLVDMFGSVENLVSATNFYYENFYSQAERNAKTTEQLTTAFEGLGYTLPATRDEFRSLVESLDMTTSSGQATFAALMGLAPALTSVTATTEALAAAAVTLASAQLELDQDLAGRALRLMDAGPAAELYELAISHESALAEARGQGLEVGLLQVIQEREFAAERKRILEEAHAAFQAFSGDVMMRTLRAGGQSGVADLLGTLISQEQELNEARAAGYDTTKLAALHATEYANALKSQQSAALGQLNSAEQAYASAVAQQQRQALQAAYDMAEAWKRVADDIRKTMEDLRGGDLSTLSPEQKLAQARGLYYQTLSAARGGDMQAAQNLSGYANSYAQQARDYYASGSQYAQIFNSIMSGLGSVKGMANTQADPADKMLEQLQGAREDSLATATAALDQARLEYQTTLSLDATAREHFEEYQQVGDASLGALEQQLDILTSMRSDTSAMVKLLQPGTMGPLQLDLPSYGVGSPYVRGDQVASVHDGEMIIDRASADALRSYGIRVAASGGGNDETVAELKEQNRILQDHMRVLQEGFNRLLEGQAASNDKIDTQTRAIKLDRRVA